MNQNVIQGKWKQIRGQFKIEWGKLSHDNMQKVGGKFEQFMGLLQEKVGHTQQRAHDKGKVRKNVRL